MSLPNSDSLNRQGSAGLSVFSPVSPLNVLKRQNFADLAFYVLFLPSNLANRQGSAGIGAKR
jgi:hypothetical protein